MPIRRVDAARAIAPRSPERDAARLDRAGRRSAAVEQVVEQPVGRRDRAPPRSSRCRRRPPSGRPRAERRPCLQRQLDLRAASASASPAAAAPRRRSPSPRPCWCRSSRSRRWCRCRRRAASGTSVAQVEPGRSSDTILLPGATRSGLTSSRSASARASCRWSTVSSSRDHGAPGVQRADGDRVRRIAGRRDAAEHRLPRRRPCRGCRPTPRRRCPRPRRVFTARHSGSVTHGSVTGWPSDRLMTRMLYLARFAIDPVDAGDHVAGVADAVAAEHADVDEVRAGRDAALVERRRPSSPAGDDAGDVRAVTERVGGARSRRSRS